MSKAPAIDLSKLSAKQLTDLKTKIDGMLPRQHEAERAALRERLARMAEQAGYRLDAVLAATPKRARRTRAKRTSSVPVKYRNPANSSETWSGRGRPARWLQAFLDAGHKREQYAVA